MEDQPEAINRFYRLLLPIIGNQFSPLTSTGKGLNGWKRSYDLGNTSAKFAIGGQQGRALLSLPGTACTHIRHQTWEEMIHLIGGEYLGRITRWDGAADDYAGLHSIEWALEQYHSNGFKSGGNRPKASTRGDWINNEGDGRTLYIGSRKNGKLVRIYEKGRQLGDRNSPWVRWELELHRKDREIPFDVLISPGQYVAGAYPCMSWIQEETSRIATFKQTAGIGYDFMTHCARQSYGRFLRVMLAVEKDPAKVLDKLIRSGKPKRLDMPAPAEYLDQLHGQIK